MRGRVPIEGVPHVPRLTAFRDASRMIQDPVAVFERYRKTLGPTFSFHFGGAKLAFVSTEPDIIEHVLKTAYTRYDKSDIQIDRMGEFQGQGLLNSHGAPWLRQRRLISRGFRRSVIDGLLPRQVETLETALAPFDTAARRGPVDVHHAMIRLTLRLVGTSLFGSGLRDEELEQVAHAIETIQQFIVRQIVRPYKIPWFRLSGQSRRHQDLRVAADDIVRRLIEVRRRSPGDGGDMLQMLLDTPYGDTGETMSPEQVLIEILQLMVAGNETSSVALSWTFYLLSRHREHLAPMRAEIEEHLGDGPITLAGLHRLELTTRVLQETMRLYPSFWMIDRQAMVDDRIGDYAIPRGATVVPYIYGTHRNPALWPDPERFDPARFTREASAGRHRFAHIPFGGGPRVCIGNNLAMMQMLLLVALIVRRYDIEPAHPAPVPARPMMILRPAGPIPLRFRPLERA